MVLFLSTDLNIGENNNKKVKIKCMDVIIVNCYQLYYALLDHISSKNIVHKKPLHINLFQVVICNKKGHHIKLHKYKDGHHKKQC